MRPFTHTISFADALARVMEAALPIERTEIVSVAEADGRVAATDVTAAIDVPPFDRAAMDGYAVRAEDTRGATASDPRLATCVGRAFLTPAPQRTGSRCVRFDQGRASGDGLRHEIAVGRSLGASVLAAARRLAL